MERRLAAILAADVAEYSHHTELNEEASTATVRSYCAVVEESISAHRGHVFSSAGDGVVAEFPSIVEAIRCAVEIQNEIAERNASVPEAERMRFRIGVNLGDVIAEENHYYGTGVNVAARLEQLAEPGGTASRKPSTIRFGRSSRFPSRILVSAIGRTSPSRCMSIVSFPGPRRRG